jgi:folate-dependent phosphoribosylglycinamide formyltransferase PurN
MEEAEWKIYPRAIRLFAQGRLAVRGRQVIISELTE